MPDPALEPRQPALQRAHGDSDRPSIGPGDCPGDDTSGIFRLVPLPGQSIDVAAGDTTVVEVQLDPTRDITVDGQGGDYGQQGGPNHPPGNSCGNGKPCGKPFKLASDYGVLAFLSSAAATWRGTMSNTPLPHAGCFKAQYPGLVWQQVPCGTAPANPYGPPARVGRQRQRLLGGDDRAHLPVRWLVRQRHRPLDQRERLHRWGEPVLPADERELHGRHVGLRPGLPGLAAVHLQRRGPGLHAVLADRVRPLLPGRLELGAGHQLLQEQATTNVPVQAVPNLDLIHSAA